MPFWNQLNLQYSTSSLMEPLDQFHDFSLVFLEFVLFALLCATMMVSFLQPPSTALSDNHLVEALWTVYPGLLLLLLGLPSLTLLYTMDCVSDPSLTMSVTGHQWYWTYALPELSSNTWDSYMLSNSASPHHRLLDVDTRATLPSGTTTRALVTSSDVLHAWSLSSAAVKVDAVPGRVNQLNLVLNKSGVFYGQCSELCGPNHSFMPIVMEVSPWSSFKDI